VTPAGLEGGTEVPRRRVSIIVILGLLFGAITAVASAILAAPVVASWLAAERIPAGSITEGVSGGVVAGLILFIAILLIGRYSRRQELTGEPAVPPALLADWKEILFRTRETYSPRSQSITSCVYAMRNVVSALNSAKPSDPQTMAANAMSNAWVTHASSEPGLTWMGTILDRYAVTDLTAFWMVKEIIDTTVTYGSAYADNFVSVVRSVSDYEIPRHVKDEWETFREPANRLGEAINALARRTYETLGQGTLVTVTTIRAL
jgi:hypothetical protein